MKAKYADEKSNLSVVNTLFTFPQKYFSCFLKRIFYNYFLRDFNMGSLSALIAIAFIGFGVLFGSMHWYSAWKYHTETPAGTIMLAALPLILGFQSLIFFFQFDIANTPRKNV